MAGARWGVSSHRRTVLKVGWLHPETGVAATADDLLALAAVTERLWVESDELVGYFEQAEGDAWGWLS